MHRNNKLPVRFLGECIQLAYVVRDLEAAMRYWTEVMHVGPFVAIESSRGVRTVRHRGTETAVEWSLAFAYMGDIQIELICQTNSAPSAYMEFLDAGREGLHHLGFWPGDFRAACTALEAQGFAELSSILDRDGNRSVVYYDASPILGSVIEVVDPTEERATLFGRVSRLARDWDGETRPIRRFTDRADFLASGQGATTAAG